MLSQLIPFLMASVMLTLSPGPDIIFVLVQGIANARKQALITTLGLSTGILIHTSLVAFGVSALIRESQALFYLIKILGAIYLLYLAYLVFKSDSDIAISGKDVKQKPLLRLYKQGFLMNVLNPKVSLFFLAFFPGFLWEPSGDTLLQFYILGGLFMLLTMLIFGTVALLAGKISRYLKRHRHFGLVIKWLQIIVFIGIALFIFF